MENDFELEEFHGLRVVDFDPEVGLSEPGIRCARVRTLYVPREEPPVEPAVTTMRPMLWAALIALLIGAWFWSWWLLIPSAVVFFFAVGPGPLHGYEMVPIMDRLELLVTDPGAGELQALVIGMWDEVDASSKELVEKLVEVSDRLPRLEAIFLGDITPEECEISWIHQTDLTPLADAFPQLKVLVARGGDGLRLTDFEHQALERLVLQTGGMFPDTIADVASARLPELRELELWLGDPIYGFSSTVDELEPLWDPATFPKLEVLAIRNAELADEIAVKLRNRPESVQRLRRLDLSMGTLSDLGAQALFDNPAIGELESLDLHYHYMSEEWVSRLQALPLDVDVSQPQGAVDPSDEARYDDPMRYVAVSE